MNESGPSVPRVLIISFSPIHRDARVLKQVALLSKDYVVTTCGYGPAPEGASEHVRIPDHLVSWRLDRPAVMMRRFARAQREQEVVAWTRDRLKPGHFDVILANDAETMPLARALHPRGGIHADLHEYASRQKEGNRRWRTFVAPYVRWLVRVHVTHADSVTTVGEGLAREYAREFGLDAGVVTNATPFRDARPGPTQAPLRAVHSGAALPDRHLEVMIEAMREVNSGMTLDMYLTRNDPGYIDRLRSRAEAVNELAGAERVRVLDPVPYEQLLDTLAEYHLGVFVIPPVSFNYRWTLPNKIFDFVQARLAVVVSPSPEMKRVVEQWGLGAVTPGFTSSDLARTLRALTVEDVHRYRDAVHAAARDLSAEHQIGGWKKAVDLLARRAMEAQR